MKAYFGCIVRHKYYSRAGADRARGARPVAAHVTLGVLGRRAGRGSRFFASGERVRGKGVGMRALTTPQGLGEQRLPEGEAAPEDPPRTSPRLPLEPPGRVLADLRVNH